jgi:hypothetical protein
MDTRRWMNQSQPQTMVIAVLLLYVNAVFALLDLLRFGRLTALPAVALAYFLVTIVGGVLAGRFIANERRIGYYLGLVAALAPFVLSYWVYGNPFSANVMTLLFEIALVALLLHPQSREYEKVWFK